MAPLRRLLRRFLSFFRSSHAERELQREIASHLQLLEEEFIARGMSAENARYAARRAFGGVEQVKERQRDARSFRWMSGLSLDLRLGLRMLVKSPGLTLVGGIGMAVAIAIGSTFFVMLYSYVQPDVPLDDAERLVALKNWDAAASEEERRSLHDFETWRTGLSSLSEIGAFQTLQRNLVVDTTLVEAAVVAEMTASGFQIARVPPLLGRTLVPDDERPEAANVAVIAHDLWKRRFASDPSILGRTVRLGSTVYTIVGVMPEGFAFPVNHRMWIPFRASAASSERRQGPSIGIFGRLAPGASLESTQAELTAVGQRTAVAYPDSHGRLTPRVLHFTELYDAISMGSGERWHIHLIQFFVTLLLGVVGANVSVLVYARTAGRLSEIGVRTALGASRGRVIGQLFVEALVLSMLAALAGLTLAAIALERIAALIGDADGLPFWIRPGLSPAAIAYAVGLAVVAAAIAGVLPALQATGSRLQSALRQLGGSTGLQLGKTWTALIVTQVAFAVTVIPGPAYFTWDLLRTVSADWALSPEEYLTATVEMDGDPPPSKGVAGYHQAFAARFEERLSELTRQLASDPAVSHVTFASGAPGQEPTATIEFEGIAPPGSSDGHQVRVLSVDSSFFEAFDASILVGRLFRPAAPNRTLPEVVISHSTAQTILAGLDPIGHRLRYVHDGKRGPWQEVVGVVSDISGTAPAMYHQRTSGQIQPMRMFVRARSGVPAALADSARRTAVAIDPTMRLENVQSLDALYASGEQGMTRIGALAFALVTVSVLLLSAAGIYALMSFTVVRRRREIGIRIALGADRRQLLMGIFARALRQIGVGIVAGALLAALLETATGGGLIQGPVAVVLPLVAVVMAIVGTLATVGPARAGLRINPTEALRSE